MKIVHVVNSLECGGLEQMALQLVKQLNSGGTPSDIVCLAGKGDLAAAAEGAGVRVVALGKPPGLRPGLVFRLAKVCKELGADIVHTHNFAPLIYGSLAARLAGKKCINTRHGRTDGRVSGLIWNLNDFVVPVSRDTETHLLRHNRIARRKIRMIYNGVDLGRYARTADETKRRATREGLGIGPESFVIINVGRLSPEKDQASLLKAFRRMRRKKMDAFLLLVGDGPLRDKLRWKSEEFEIADRVKFLGFRDDVVSLLQASDVFVLSSYREGLSLSLLEAMACGKPVVATRIGGTPEAVVDDETGFLVPCGFPERIEVAVQKLFINRQKAAEMGAAARRKMEEQFSLARMAGEYQQLYSDALGKR
jgi:glycosyltransferase involved in cell wall biosynthesis